MLDGNTKRAIDTLVSDATVGRGNDAKKPSTKDWQKLADLLQVDNVPTDAYDYFLASWRYHVQHIVAQP